MFLDSTQGGVQRLSSGFSYAHAAHAPPASLLLRKHSAPHAQRLSTHTSYCGLYIKQQRALCREVEQLGRGPSTRAAITSQRAAKHLGPGCVMQPAAFILLVGLISAASATSEYKWKITADDRSLAAVQSEQFTGNENDEVMAIWFQQWKQEYGKTYATPQQERAAMQNFRQSLRDVRRVNTDKVSTHVADVNQFADLGFDAFSNGFLMKTDPTKAFARRLLASDARPGEVFSPNLADLQHQGRKLQATSVDWRAKWKVTPVKYQGQCGACWAFAATAAIESAYHIYKNTNATAAPINLSEQQLVSCATAAAGYYSAGCNGGCSDMAINYVFKVNQTTEARYLYSATTGTCDNAIVSGVKNLPVQALQLGGAVRYIQAQNQSALMAALNKQPVVIYWMVTSSFYSYKSGIYTSTSSCTTSINHAMLAVGYYWTGSTAGSYWIVKNSWATTWGEKGFVRIAMTGDGLGPCLLLKYPLVPVLSFKKSL